MTGLEFYSCFGVRGSGGSLSNYSLDLAEGSLCSGRDMWLFEGQGLELGL